MEDNVFFKANFFLLVAFSLVFPIAIYIFLLKKNIISRWTILAYATILIALSGIDIVLLRALAGKARETTSILDDAIFSSELSVALYLLPAVFAGIGINLISHVLISHLSGAERKFDQQHQHEQRAASDQARQAEAD